MHESEVPSQSTHQRPHNVIALQVRQSDNLVSCSWKNRSVSEHLGDLIFVGQFAGIIAKKALEVTYVAAKTSIHQFISRD